MPKEKDDHYVILEIHSGMRNTYRLRGTLKEEGFIFTKRSCGRSFWSKKIYSGEEIIRYRNFCKRQGLKLIVVPQDSLRNHDYRKQFFSDNFPDKRGRYRCAYCGRHLPKEKVTVDHIFPVKAMQISPLIRKMAGKCGIINVNDTKNLCASCDRCNKRKGTKTGLWVIRGFIGRKAYTWQIRNILICIALCVAGTYLLSQIV